VATESGYYQLWVGRLPYHRFFEKTTPEAEERFIRSSPYFLKKSYRTRTLQGILHPDDLVSVKVSELSDRLYLWTWRWLADPAGFPLERIMALLREFEPRDVARQTTVEDFQLIRNALTWISLFDPTSDLVVQRLLQSMAPAQNREYPILGFERELLSYLRAERDHRKTEASDFLAGLRSHPFWKSPDLKLARLADGRVPEGSPLTGLAERIARLRQPVSHARNRLRVELETGRIVSARDGRSVVSQPMAAAFDLLHSLESIDCARFAQVCFGLSRFDAIIHGPKIFNLLSRMRGLSPPELRFSVKSGRVWAKGPWTQVEIERGGGLSGTIQSHPEWSTLTARTVAQASSAAADAAERWARPAQALKQLRGQAELTRKELEKLTGKSRSTANRIIERWLKQGILVRSGKARNTVYKFIGVMMLALGLAAAAPEAAEAKPFTIWSGPCANEASQLPSMGFAFHGAYQGHPGKTYVVTSHHRVFNGNEEQGVCHFVHTGLSTQRARLVAWDWGASLALLEVEGDFAPEFLGLEGSRDYDAVKIAGNWDYGETIVGASDRHLMPLLPSARVLEVVRAAVSPSRIGAPVYSPHFTGPEGFAGIISHQYVRMVPGRASSVETWDFEPEHRESHLLIIRQADIVRFINRYFRDRMGKPWRPLVGATLEDQREGRARVSVGGLIFEEDCPGPAAPGLKGIGVGVPQPIGGAAEPSYCTIRIRRDEFGSWEGFNSEDYPDRLARLLKELRANLAQGGSAEILFSFWEDAHYAIIPYGYPSLQYFFRQTSLGDRREVVVYDDQAQASMTVDPDVKALRKASQELLRALPSAEGLPRDSQVSVNLRIRLPALLTILGSSRWADLFDAYKGRLEEFGPAGLAGVNPGPDYLGKLEE
ncbi:MAG TPA: helix-turn-helix domain-containing protein, partial [Bdellovibrionota bacterium]|nr:helix-turn-helix domain-containing protein [Bdellovibrionota bacterium]